MPLERPTNFVLCAVRRSSALVIDGIVCRQCEKENSEEVSDQSVEDENEEDEDEEQQRFKPVFVNKKDGVTLIEAEKDAEENEEIEYGMWKLILNGTDENVLFSFISVAFDSLHCAKLPHPVLDFLVLLSVLLCFDERINVVTAGEALLALTDTRNSGQSIRTQNVTAACAIANIVKSSLGLNKMLVDDVGDVLTRKLARELQEGRYLEKNLAIPTEELGHESIIGSNVEFFSEMVVKAAELEETVDASGKVIYLINAVNVLKAHRNSASESMLIEGYALNCTLASEAMPRKRHLGISVVVEDPTKLEAIRREKMDIVKRRIDKILKAGANVVRTTGGIDDLCFKLFTEVGVMAVKRCKKVDLERVAKATDAIFVSSLANLEGDESFGSSVQGTCEEIVQERISDDELITIKKTGARSAASLILRGANDVMLDEMERSVHDALCVCRRVLESRNVVCGGGAVEAALNVYLEAFATSLASREQLPMAVFADALLVIPLNPDVKMDIVKRRIDKILKAGANVVRTTGGIDDLCFKLFTEVGVMAVKRCKKVDLERVAKATDAIFVSSLANLEGDESFGSSVQGTCEEIVQERISDDELITIKKTGARSAASIILRGANDVMLDEMERSVHDALCVCRRVLESRNVVCGGGAVEAALNVYLEAFATSLASREQLPPFVLMPCSSFR
ncbi:hypothetical protein QR680_000416 [Steinernema hermaphroditum]|uniref:T-complex protein 1 subunit alpha n=1 Tax=Steinernema hermaphroditum TaxID=289476 RepID=A0AA39GW21_9BILA|nr:hypothetical protein QR680_000416 [Steinernema hermaphroditum]